MKNAFKKISIFLALLIVATSAFAQESTEASSESGDDSYFYMNVPIVTVYDHNQAYIVSYLKGSIGVGECYLPKEWFKTDNVDKCRVRALPKGTQPYMTVVYKNGSIQKIYLNMPTNRRESCWKILSNNVDISDKLNTDVSSFSIEY